MTDATIGWECQLKILYFSVRVVFYFAQQSSGSIACGLLLGGKAQVTIVIKLHLISSIMPAHTLFSPPWLMSCMLGTRCWCIHSSVFVSTELVLYYYSNDTSLSPPRPGNKVCSTPTTCFADSAKYAKVMYILKHSTYKWLWHCVIISSE